MISRIKNKVDDLTLNFKGFKTKRKILVIESDDWGSIRMPSREVYNKFLNQGVKVNLCPYNTYDTLESVQDLEHTFNVLDKIRDFKGNPPVITANTVMANPDFDKIEENNFSDYFYKPFTTTFKEYYPQHNVFETWREGVKNKFFFPQLHGREHLNPEMWLEEVKNNQVVKSAFDLRTFGLSTITSPSINKPYLASLIYKDEKGFRAVSKSITDAVSIFEESFGFTSLSFIAPLYTWNDDLEPVMKHHGIKYVQAGNSHKTYDYINNKRIRKAHSFGSKSSAGLTYLNRNCIFEPSLDRAKYTADRCFKEIETAFLWNKPAVISIHRLNFIGTLVEENRSENLKQLDGLLRRVLKKWPETEFMSSPDLGKIIEGK